MPEQPKERSKNTPGSKGKFVTATEAESFLLSQLTDPESKKQDVRLELIKLYRSTQRPADAMFHAQEFMSDTTNPLETATAWFLVGQAMEQVKDFESAIRFYLLGFELNVPDPFLQYFFRNNIGYSLNQLERFSEAEGYLREAIPIIPPRANAHKNLGLSLEGQGRFIEAAESYVTAVKTNPGDPRALHHLEELVGRHTELFAKIPDLFTTLMFCRKAIADAVGRKHSNN